MRLREESLTSAERKEVMRVLFATTSIPSPANEDSLPLFAYVEESVREARELLPSFDEWGPRSPAGLMPHSSKLGRSWRASRTLSST